MVNGIVPSLLRPGDFRPQHVHALIQFGDREWIEILPRQRGQNVIGPARQIFVHVHAREC